MKYILTKLLALSLCIHAIYAQTAQDYKISNLPGIDINTLNFDQYAGYVELSNVTNSNLFFWMIEKEIKIEPEKLIVWLNGGPGCSSMDGLFVENGPYRVNEDLTISINEGGWHKYSTVVYYQPVGTGFSQANPDSFKRSMDEVSDDFVLFLDKFFKIFPHLSNHDLYISGESFAGSYIPYFSKKLLEKTEYRLKGIAIGNGWISPKHQYEAYHEYGLKMDLIDANLSAKISDQIKTCKENMKEENTIHVRSCNRILNSIARNNTYLIKDPKKCINVYDIRFKNESSPSCGLYWPGELDYVAKYLRTEELKTAIHVSSFSGDWVECGNKVSSALHGDQSKPSYDLLPEILEKIQVLLYAGEFDLICNYVGIENLISNMTWNGATGFSDEVQKKSWKVNDLLAGYYKQERNLSYVFIKDGSHMVPYDHPLECFDMMNRFMNIEDYSNRFVKSELSIVLEEDEKVRTTREFSLSGNEENHSYWSTILLCLILLASLTGIYYCYQRATMKGTTLIEFGGIPQRERENTRKPNLFRSMYKIIFSKSQNRKTRLENPQDSNELDELVIEAPVLFEAGPSAFESDVHLNKLSQDGRR